MINAGKFKGLITYNIGGNHGIDWIRIGQIQIRWIRRMS